MNKHKIERIQSDILRYIDQIILTEVTDEEIKKVTITECNVTHDLSYATLYYTSFSDLSSEDMQKKLEDAAGFLRGKLSALIELRHTPSLRFKYDDTIENGQKIEKILKDIQE